MTRQSLVTTALIPALLLSGCNFAPAYHRPVSVGIPATFKEAPGWKIATPSDAVARGEWWLLFNDDVLDDLERKVIVSNQNIAQAKAAYDQARALVRQERAALFPVVSLQGQGNYSGSFVNPASTSTTTTTTTPNSGLVSLDIGVTWEPDLWGAISNTVSQDKAQAQASAGDLINATLSAQGEVALNYVQLRGIEAQKIALDQTVVDYTHALTITVNMYNVGVAARSDVLQAEVALRNAKAQAVDLIRQRAILEHAIAVLVGENPSTFSVPAKGWSRAVPAVPSILPSTLLERRPDVAAAERLAAAANAAIGIQKAAFFPTISLSGQAGSTATSVAGLFDVASTVWSLGVTGLLTLLDFGARTARVDQARAAYGQAVATYRQTVLTAFQQVEDQLSATDILRSVSDERAAAAAAANKAEVIARNQYVAGQVAYTTVIVAETTALAARTADIQAVTNRQTAAISLIQAIGGNWTAPTALPAGYGR